MGQQYFFNTDFRSAPGSHTKGRAGSASRPDSDPGGSVRNNKSNACARICVLDADVGCLYDVEQLLQAMGHQVLCLNQVVGASNRIREFDPDLLVVDVMSPTLSGARLIDILRMNIPCLPVLILFSALDRENLANLAKKTGAADYAVKKDNYLELVNRVQYHASRV